MWNRRRSFAGLALLAGAALALGGCNFSKTGAVPLGAPDIVTVVPVVANGATTLNVDPGTAMQLNGLGITLTPTGAAVASGSALSFPITSGYAEVHRDHSVKPGWIQGSLDHASSGLDITSGTTTVHLSDFVVDPGGSMLYATVDGKPSQPLMTLDGTKVTETVDQAGDIVLDGTVASLTQAGANALNTAFATTALSGGLTLGDVHVLIATGEPLPAGATSFADAGLTGTTYNASTDQVTPISRLTGTSTTLTLEPDVAQALMSAGVNIKTRGMATMSGGSVSFPITGGFVAIHSNKAFRPGYVVGSILHQESGITLGVPGGPSVTLGDFVVDPGNSVLTGLVDGREPAVPLFFLDGSKLTVTPTSGGATLDGTVAELTQPAAAELDQTFATTMFTPGMPIGTVHLVATGS